MKKLDTKTIAIIPARKGSVGFPNKNLKKLGDKNLIQITVDSAVKSNVIDRFYLTTDYQENEIGQIDKRVIFLARSSQASSTTATATDVLKDVFGKFAFKDLELDPVIVYLQPTSVFRTSSHIIGAMKLFRDTGENPIVSVCSHPIQFEKLLTLSASNELEPIISEDLSSINRNHENSMYYPNGAIYIFKYSQYVARNIFPIDLAKPFKMDWISSLDIDNSIDLMSAERVWGKSIE
jgi:CMP-N-acetylneuraminic acid synthetase